MSYFNLEFIWLILFLQELFISSIFWTSLNLLILSDDSITYLGFCLCIKAPGLGCLKIK